MSGEYVRGSTWRDEVSWRVIRPLAWWIAGVRDRAATVRSNRSRDIVR